MPAHPGHRKAVPRTNCLAADAATPPQTYATTQHPLAHVQKHAAGQHTRSSGHYSHVALQQPRTVLRPLVAGPAVSLATVSPPRAPRTAPTLPAPTPTTPPHPPPHREDALKTFDQAVSLVRIIVPSVTLGLIQKAEEETRKQRERELLERDCLPREGKSSRDSKD